MQFRSRLARMLLMLILLTVGVALAQDQPGQVKYPTALDSLDSLIRVSDNARAVLRASLPANATTATVDDTSLFSSSGFLTIDGRERVTYTSKDAKHFNGLLRGQQGTPALVHPAGVSVEGRILAVEHNTLAEVIRRMQIKLGSGSSTPSAGKFYKGTGPGTAAYSALTASEVTTALGYTPAAGVASVGLALPPIFTVSGSPITGSGTLTAALANQGANKVLASLATGSDGTPAFRALVAADLPATVAYTDANNTYTGSNIFQGVGIAGTAPTARRPFNMAVSGINQTALGGDYIGATIVLSGGGGTIGEHMVGLGINLTATQNMPNTGSPIGINVQTNVAAGITSDQLQAVNANCLINGTVPRVYSSWNQVIGLPGGTSTITTQTNFNDISAVGSGVLANPILFHGQIRSLSGGTITGTAIGIDLSNWSGNPATSYGIYMDASIDRGATRYAIYSLSTSPSLLSGDLTIGGLLRFAGSNSTGSGSALLASNSPAITNAAPYTWVRVITADGSTGYMPVWK